MVVDDDRGPCDRWFNYVTLQVTAVDSNFPNTSNIQQPAQCLWR